MSKIKLKAKKGAPDFVQVGNLTAEIKDGFFHAETQDFADYLIGAGYAEEITAKKPAAVAAKKTAPKAAAKPAVEPTEEKTDESAEKTTEGDTK